MWSLVALRYYYENLAEPTSIEDEAMKPTVMKAVIAPGLIQALSVVGISLPRQIICSRVIGSFRCVRMRAIVDH